MADWHLIVSDPPHSDPDEAAVALLLGCTAAEARMKLNFSAPEIWLAETDRSAAGNAAKALLDVGAAVAWVPGSVLAAVPPVSVASAISVDSSQIVIDTSDGELAITAQNRVAGVLVEPVQREVRPASSRSSVLTQKVPGRGPVRSLPFVSNVAVGIGGVAGYKVINKLDKLAADAKEAAAKSLGDTPALEPSEMFLDVYALGDRGWRAARLAPGCTDFSGLGDRMLVTGRANISAITKLLEDDFAASVDKRIKKVTYKAAVVSGVALNQVLRSISITLGELQLLDMGSKLAFLTSKGR